MNDSMPQMTIHFQGPPDGDRISDVQALVDLICTNKGLKVKPTIEDAPDRAKPMLTSALEIVGAGTAVACLGLQAISIWQQGKPKYSITVSDGGRSYQLENLSREDFLSLLRQLSATSPNPTIEVKIETRKR